MKDTKEMAVLLLNFDSDTTTGDFEANTPQLPDTVILEANTPQVPDTVTSQTTSNNTRGKFLFLFEFFTKQLLF